MEVNIYIRFETLKMKCTQYGICGQVAFKNASTLVFLKSGGRAAVFGRVQEKCGGLPPDRIFPPGEKLIGGSISSAHSMTGLASMTPVSIHQVSPGNISQGLQLIFIFIFKNFRQKANTANAGPQLN